MNSAEIIDGKKIAAEIRAELKERIQELKSDFGVTPGLAVILVGEDPASQSYVAAKEKACAEIGVFSDDNRLPAATTQQELLELIARKNADPRIHGILVQLPLPRHIDTDAVIAAIAPEKDVDGFSPVSLGKLMIGLPTFISCTPHGIVQLLMRSGVKLAGAHVVVVGRSNIVGKPVANLLIQKAAYGGVHPPGGRPRRGGRPSAHHHGGDGQARRGGHRRRREPRRGPHRAQGLSPEGRRGLRRRPPSRLENHAGPRRRRPDDHHHALVQYGTERQPNLPWRMIFAL